MVSSVATVIAAGGAAAAGAPLGQTTPVDWNAVQDAVGRPGTMMPGDVFRIGMRIGGEVGNTQFDAGSHQIFAAVQTRNQVVTIDPSTDQVSGRYDTPGCDHPHGLQISPDRRLAFVACEGNAKLVVMDLQTMAVPDVLAFDAPRRVLYVAPESGPVTAFSETETGLKPLAQNDVGPNAHVVAVDPDTGHVYFPIANLGGQPMLRESSVTTATVGDGDD
jgi:DNA-binding beta-propeller fold protein YncE